MSIIDNQRLGPFIFAMTFGRLALPDSSIPLMTSDRPLYWSTHGLDSPDSFIALPVGPRTLFVAGNLRSFVYDLEARSDTEAVQRVNQVVVQQARQFVWGVDHSQLQLVRDEMGLMPDEPVISEEERQGVIRAMLSASGSSVRSGL